jgi:hypothetical protein
MINFKKRLKDLKDLNQTMLDLPPGKPKEAEQTELAVCQICGHTWQQAGAKNIERFWKKEGGPGPMCNLCWTIWSLRNQAHARGISLRKAVKNFLFGAVKRMKKPLDELWRGRKPDTATETGFRG